MRGEMAAPREDRADGLNEEFALVQAAQLDPSAFAPLYDRYRHRVYADLRVRLATDEDAADLTQQVFLQALSALPRYRVRSVPFGVWLFRIARNATVDLHRRHRPTVAWESVPEELHPREEADPEARLEPRCGHRESACRAGCRAGASGSGASR